MDMQILGARVDLEVPRSFAARYDVLTIDNSHRQCAAALGLCWPKLGRKLRKAGIRYNGDSPPVFGGQVLDFMLAEGAALRDILAAGVKAIELCADGLPGLEAQEEEEGNSEPEEGSTTT